MKSNGTSTPASIQTPEPAARSRATAASTPAPRPQGRNARQPGKAVRAAKRPRQVPSEPQANAQKAEQRDFTLILPQSVDQLRALRVVVGSVAEAVDHARDEFSWGEARSEPAFYAAHALHRVLTEAEHALLVLERLLGLGLAANQLAEACEKNDWEGLAAVSGATGGTP